MFRSKCKPNFVNERVRIFKVIINKSERVKFVFGAIFLNYLSLSVVFKHISTQIILTLR